MRIHRRQCIALGTVMALSPKFHKPAIAQSTPAIAPHDTLITLSPDGKLVAGVRNARRLAIWDATRFDPEPVAESDEHEAVRMLDSGSLAWSPDSSMLAFGVNAWLYGVDGDIFVADLDATITNLTPEGTENELPSFFDAKGVFDTFPTWSPDGDSIAFSRSEMDASETWSNFIYTIPPTGGAPELFAHVADGEPGIIMPAIEWISADSVAVSIAWASPTEAHDLPSGVYVIRRGAAPEPVYADSEIRALRINGITADRSAAILETYPTDNPPAPTRSLLSITDGTVTDFADIFELRNDEFIMIPPAASPEPDANRFAAVVSSPDGYTIRIAEETRVRELIRLPDPEKSPFLEWRGDVIFYATANNILIMPPD